MSTASPGPTRIHGAPVYVGEVRIGTASEVIAEASAARIVGLVVTSRDDRRWFLPWVACAVEAGAIRCSSPLVFLPERELAFYLREGVRVSPAELAVAAIGRNGHVVRQEPGLGPSVLALAPEGISPV